MPATSNGEYGRVLCNKTFCQKIPDFSPDSGFFRNFFISPWSLDHSWDIMFYKVVYILISLRGDSKSMRYVVTADSRADTHRPSNLYTNKFSENLKWLIVQIEDLWRKFKDFLFCLSRLQCILNFFLCGFPLNGNLFIYYSCFCRAKRGITRVI